MQRGVLLIRLMIGGLFLATAALKVLAPAESAALAVAYNVSPLLTAAVVQVELGGVEIELSAPGNEAAATLSRQRRVRPGGPAGGGGND